MLNELQLTKGCKVLVVDDKKENLDLLTGILEHQGFEVSFAMNGQQAIQIATLNRPDLILLDVMMPGIDGFETCRRMKALNDLRDIPVIFVTALTEVKDMVTGLSIGAVDYVTKPIHQEEIIARVQTHLQIRQLIRVRDELIEQLRLQNIEQKKITLLKQQQLEKNSKLSYLGEIIGELTHELGTPLGVATTAISTLADKNNRLQRALAAQTLTQSKLSEFLSVSEEHFNIVMANLSNANQLTSSFKHIAVGEFSALSTTFELGEFLKDVIHVLTPKFKRSRHEVVLTENRECVVHGESGALSQVIINLINNALRHAFDDDAHGRIEIGYSRLNDDQLKEVTDENGLVSKQPPVCITVSDNGRGIASEHLAHIFDKYFTTKREQGGSGLGLYIVYNLVTNNLGGTIECHSEAGSGTRFTLCIPEHYQHGVEEVDPEATTPPT